MEQCTQMDFIRPFLCPFNQVEHFHTYFVSTVNSFVVFVCLAWFNLPECERESETNVDVTRLMSLIANGVQLNKTHC